MSLPPRISFGIIVLNGEPFTKYCLRQLYPHAYEIIVVEGGSKKAINIAPDGHSIDGTLESLNEFKAKEDPGNKVKIITRDGFWSEKDEQSQAYAKVATGDYLWQVDIDEFYRHEDIEKVLTMLSLDPTIDTVSFKQFTFWGSPWITADSFVLRSDAWDQYHRLFKWSKDYTYKTHRPPTVLDERGIDLKNKHWIKGYEMAKRNIFLFHYSLLFPIQVLSKCRYYATSTSVTRKGYAPGMLDWAENSYFNIRRSFRVHNVYRSISWLKKCNISHPEEAMQMWNDAVSGRINVDLRDNTDVDKLLQKPNYAAAAAFLSLLASFLRFYPMKWCRKLCMALAEKYIKLRKM